MRVAADAGGLQAGGGEGIQNLVLRHVAHGLDAFETRVPDGFELRQNGDVHLNGAVHDGLVEIAGFPERGGGESGGSGKKKVASVHEVHHIR